MIVAETSDAAAVVRRIRRIALAAYVALILPAVMTGGWWGFVGLTCAAAVNIICFLWLEQILEAIVQPSPRLRAWKVVLRTLIRYALLGAALAVTILVARFNALSVLLGFSIVVVGIIGEGLYSTFRSFAN
ncbi:MAG TPA: ATP synthase subunit I [Thermoanaerobaculia bacterium]